MNFHWFLEQILQSKATLIVFLSFLYLSQSLSMANLKASDSETTGFLIRYQSKSKDTSGGITQTLVNVLWHEFAGESITTKICCHNCYKWNAMSESDVETCFSSISQKEQVKITIVNLPFPWHIVCMLSLFAKFALAMQLQLWSKEFLSICL